MKYCVFARKMLELLERFFGDLGKSGLQVFHVKTTTFIIKNN